MKKTRIVLGMVVISLFITMFSGCGENAANQSGQVLPTSVEEIHKTEPDEYAKVEQVGQVPEAFQQIIADDGFSSVVAFGGRLLKTETVAFQEDTRTVTHQVCMTDLYGENLATYSCDSSDAYHVQTLTATKDGGFLFVLGFSDYQHQHKWVSEDGFASRVIKCDAEGAVQFDVPLDGIEGMALRHCFEKNGKYYFFGTMQAPETKKQGVYSVTDIYLAVINENGSVLKESRIAGTDFDNLYAVEMCGDDFLLSICSQSDDGAFEGSGSNGYGVMWTFTVNDNLAVIQKELETGRDYFDYRIGEKDGVPVYVSDVQQMGFGAGTPCAFIDYGDYFMIVSYNTTGIYDRPPMAISSLWYYTESVYSAYDYSGKLLFRASVDTTPDYDAMLDEYMANETFQS